ncbi:hypothetical protein J4732_08310 [Serratia marcescens]|uniref:Uncharacterized protein n=1 Tax=Serratia marcescens TaxID=615 RepID=A0A939NNY3_SERMA|nr:hypothetical protein [Serratia marcescens]
MRQPRGIKARPHRDPSQHSSSRVLITSMATTLSISRVSMKTRAANRPAEPVAPVRADGAASWRNTFSSIASAPAAREYGAQA